MAGLIRISFLKLFDVRTTGRQGIVVVSTLAGLAEYADERGDAALREAADGLNKRNLALLINNGVPVAIGSDAYVFACGKSAAQ